MSEVWVDFYNIAAVRFFIGDDSDFVPFYYCDLFVLCLLIGFFCIMCAVDFVFFLYYLDLERNRGFDWRCSLLQFICGICVIVRFIFLFDFLCSLPLHGFFNKLSSCSSGQLVGGFYYFFSNFLHKKFVV